MAQVGSTPQGLRYHPECGRTHPSCLCLVMRKQGSCLRTQKGHFNGGPVVMRAALAHVRAVTSDGTTTVNTLLWTPRSSHLDGPLLPPSRGFFFPSPLFFGSTVVDTMAAAVAGAKRLFSPTQGNLPDILRKWCPLPGGTR